MPTLGPKRKKPRASASQDGVSKGESQIVYSEMERVTHKSEQELRRAAKKVLGFETQKAIKKLKDLQTTTTTAKEATKSQTKKLNAATRNLDLVKTVTIDLITSVSLRRLGLKHTGMGNDPLLTSPETVKKLVEKCIAQKTLKTLMDSLNVKIVNVRKKDMAASEAPKSKKGKKRAREEKAVTGSEWSKGYEGQQGVFLTLNGNDEEEEVRRRLRNKKFM
ncbi:hypothetical protein TL16_g03125 [Triparma laevis f. inornata]|uniref:Bud22 domain-containing protein n=1 Tax=Triparma laevis f. inornata TaxID=1714386 RepID=A0A9W7A3P9_9STRA|nr:hypothetical protein TL16_g03125 [Triparma laevis f. inornata]